jgi:hypothetical protein
MIRASWRAYPGKRFIIRWSLLYSSSKRFSMTREARPHPALKRT